MRRRHLPARSAVAVLAAQALLLAWPAPPPAAASRLSAAGSAIGYQAAPGEVNELRIERGEGPAGALLFEDLGATIAVEPGCTALGPHHALCDGAGRYRSISLELGDGDDSLEIAGPATDLGLAVAAYGGAGEDALAGGAESDLLDGGAGEDRVAGGDGDDVLYGGEDGDSIEGGEGDDLVQSRDSAADGVACGGGADAAVADRVDVLAGCERVDAGPEPPAPPPPGGEPPRGTGPDASPPPGGGQGPDGAGPQPGDGPRAGAPGDRAARDGDAGRLVASGDPQNGVVVSLSGRVGGGGRVTATLRCPAGASGGCRGYLVLEAGAAVAGPFATARRRTRGGSPVGGLVLASAGYAVAPGQTARLTARLSRRARRRLAARRPLPVWVGLVVPARQGWLRIPMGSATLRARR